MARKLALITLLLTVGLVVRFVLTRAPSVSPVSAPLALSSEPVARAAAPALAENVEPTKREPVLAAENDDVFVPDSGEAAPTPFFVHILAHDTHLPCADAWASVDGSEHMCDAQGVVELPDLGSPELHFLAGAPHYVLRSLDWGAGHESRERALEIELEREAILVAILENPPQAGYPALKVTTPPDRRPARRTSGDFIAGEPLVTQGHSELGTGFFDREGHLELSGLPPDLPLELRVVEGGLTLLDSPDLVAIPPGETRVVRLRIQDACRLTGVVRDERGAPLPHVPLWLLRAPQPTQLYLQSSESQQVIAHLWSDHNGSFALDCVQPGTWRIGPAPFPSSPDGSISSGGLAPIATVFGIAPGAHEQRVELTIPHGLTIAGVVLDAHGKPCSRVFVIASAGACRVGAACRADGSFELGSLPPGSYEVFGLLPGTNVPSESVHAEAGARDVVVRLQEPSRIGGRVVDSRTGEGVASQLTIVRPARPNEPEQMIFSEADGQFEIEGLAEGNYTLIATPYDERIGVLRDVEVRAGGVDLGLVVSLTPGARLSAHNHGSGPAELRVEQEGIQCASLNLEPNGIQVVAIPPGSVRLVLRFSGGREEVLELALKAGEVRDLLFQEPTGK